MQFEAMIMKDRVPAFQNVQTSQTRKVSKNIKYAQKYGGQDETDSDSSKDTSLDQAKQLDKS
jgi:tRNA splicing ligase